jgi:hypothetical protein
MARKFVRVQILRTTALFEAYMETVERTLCGRELGRGLFAKVFTYEGDTSKVIKFSRGSTDRAYLLYVQQIFKLRTHCPYLPVIHSATLLVNLEKYKEYRELGKSHTEARLEASRLLVVTERLQSVRAVPASESWEEISSTVLNNIRKCSYAEKLSSRQLQRTAAVIARIIRKWDRGIDMHAGNFMVRGEQLVFTDPVC